MAKWQREFNPDIKPLETYWKGYRFRSRLEARWAVFFDSLGIEFQYEPQGYKLPDGTTYLPDFYLPVIDMWAEVKPAELTPEQDAKCVQLVFGSNRECLLLIGAPDFHGYVAKLPYTDLHENDYLLDIDAHHRAYYNDEHRLYSGLGGDYQEEAEFTPRYRQAVYASRHERFDGKDLPRPGEEPFNLSQREMAAPVGEFGIHCEQCGRLTVVRLAVSIRPSVTAKEA